MYNKSFDISHIHIGCNIFEIFATLRYATSCQRFAVCFTVFMRCHVNQLKCVVASAIPHSLVYFSGFFSRHSSFLPLPPPHIHIYMFYNFVLFSFVCVFYHNPHSHPSNEKSNVSFLAWSMLPHTIRIISSIIKKKKQQKICNTVVDYACDVCCSRAPNLRFGMSFFSGVGDGTNILFSFFMNDFLFVLFLAAFLVDWIGIQIQCSIVVLHIMYEIHFRPIFLCNSYYMVRCSPLFFVHILL